MRNGAAGIGSAVVVVGHLGDRLIETVRHWRPRYEVRFVTNEHYATTGTAVSLRVGLAADLAARFGVAR
ncbi:hypothetical protein ABZ710_38065, partial [Streptomyces anthocyanicus]|uniref:hypothetical protein n=1 Tax=Streptomyces anthocyanicus TaxID=68174 RepID=UPI00340F03A8